MILGLENFGAKATTSFGLGILRSDAAAKMIDRKDSL